MSWFALDETRIQQYDYKYWVKTVMESVYQENNGAGPYIGGLNIWKTYQKSESSNSMTQTERSPLFVSPQSSDNLKVIVKMSGPDFLWGIIQSLAKGQEKRCLHFLFPHDISHLGRSTQTITAPTQGK